jgi:hypothetical protein
MFQKQAVTQYTEHGFCHQRTFVGANALALKKLTQQSVGRMFQRQDAAQGLDNEV